MKTKNILRTVLAAVFVLGTLAMNAQTKIYVHKKGGGASEYDISEVDSISFTPPEPPAPPVDYSKLKINEVNGVSATADTDKFYELINIGDVEIPLAGVTIEYDGASGTGTFPPVGGGQGVTWIGCASHSIAPGAFFIIQDRVNQPVDINVCVTTMRTGLTAARNLIITLKDPDGNVIDQCIRAEDTGDYAITDKSYSRIPDGTGPFYFTAPTPNATNGDSDEGLLLVPETPIPVVEEPEEDYSDLVINEVDGIGKFVEIYNNGTESVSLKNLKLVKNESQTWWTGGEGATIEAGGFYTISQSGQSTECATEATGASGISPQQNLKFELKEPDGITVIDEFVRTNGGGWGDSVTPSYTAAGYSFSRCPDGTGDFQLAFPSCNALNNESEGEIVTNP